MYNANRLQGAPNNAADVEETADTTFVHEFFTKIITIDPATGVEKVTFHR
jgi:hypothetical protein